MSAQVSISARELKAFGYRVQDVRHVTAYRLLHTSRFLLPCFPGVYDDVGWEVCYDAEHLPVISGQPQWALVDEGGAKGVRESRD